MPEKKQWEDLEIEIQKILEPYFFVLDGRDNEPANDTIIEISQNITKLAQTQLQKIAEDVIGEEESTHRATGPISVYHINGRNQKRQELITYFQSIGIDIDHLGQNQ